MVDAISIVGCRILVVVLRWGFVQRRYLRGANVHGLAADAVTEEDQIPHSVRTGLRGSVVVVASVLVRLDLLRSLQASENPHVPNPAVDTEAEMPLHCPPRFSAERTGSIRNQSVVTTQKSKVQYILGDRGEAEDVALHSEDIASGRGQCHSLSRCCGTQPCGGE